MFMFLIATAAFAENPAPVTPVAEAPAVAEAPVVAETPVAGTPVATEAPPAAEAPPAGMPEVKVPTTEGEALQQGQQAFDAFTMGAWGAGLAMALGVAFFLYNKFFAKKAS